MTTDNYSMKIGKSGIETKFQIRLQQLFKWVLMALSTTIFNSYRLIFAKCNTIIFAGITGKKQAFTIITFTLLEILLCE